MNKSEDMVLGDKKKAGIDYLHIIYN